MKKPIGNYWEPPEEFAINFTKKYVVIEWDDDCDLWGPVGYFDGSYLLVDNLTEARMVMDKNFINWRKSMWGYCLGDKNGNILYEIPKD